MADILNAFFQTIVNLFVGRRQAQDDRDARKEARRAELVEQKRAYEEARRGRAR